MMPRIGIFLSVLVCMLAVSTSALTQHYMKCPRDGNFLVALTRPNCRVECYPAEEGERALLDHIAEGANCPGAGPNFAQDLLWNVLSLPNGVCTDRNVFRDEHKHNRKNYLCIGSRATMMIVNEVMRACQGTDLAAMPYPDAQPEQMRCAPEHTYPRIYVQDQEQEQDADLQDGPMEEAPVTDAKFCVQGGDCSSTDLENLRNFLQKELVIVEKRHSFAERRRALLTSKTEENENLAARSKSAELIEYYTEKAALYHLRISANTIAVANLLAQKEDLRQDLKELLWRYPWLESRKIEKTPAEVVRRDDKTVGCVIGVNNCSGHYFKKNVKINDECYSVCVSASCTNDFGFLYCLKMTLSFGYTDPNCHADMISRKVCFEKLT